MNDEINTETMPFEVRNKIRMDIVVALNAIRFQIDLAFLNADRHLCHKHLENAINGIEELLASIRLQQTN